jgi:hypothetical protein
VTGCPEQGHLMGREVVGRPWQEQVLFFVCVGNRTQGLACVKQVLFHKATPPTGDSLWDRLKLAANLSCRLQA